MTEDEFESTRRRMQTLIDDVASLESGESERALSSDRERNLEDPRLVEMLAVKSDIEFRLFKAEEERDRENERAETLASDFEELQRETGAARDLALEESKSTRDGLDKERDRRQYLEQRLIALESEREGNLNLLENQTQNLREAKENLEDEVRGLRLSRREEQEKLQGSIRDLEGRYWKSQAEWEGERTRLETLLEQAEEKTRKLEDSVDALGAFESRCRELEDQIRRGEKAPTISPESPAELDAMLPPVDPVLDPGWKRVARILEKPLATAFGFLKKFAGTRLTDGHRVLLKKTAGEIIRAQDALKALRHLLEADSEVIETGRPETVIESVLASWEPSLRRRRITLLRRIEPTTIPVRFAPEGLRTAVYHLLRNAYQAMPHGGNLSVASERVPESPEIIFRFHDTGVGFSNERLEDPFTPFRTERTNHLGIGLAITSAVMRACGGDAEIANGKERGAVVTLRFSPPELEGDDGPSLTGNTPP